MQIEQLKHKILLFQKHLHLNRFVQILKLYITKKKKRL